MSGQGWADPLYRLRTELPDDGSGDDHRVRFGPVEASVRVTDTAPASFQAMYRPDRAVVLTLLDTVTAAELDVALPLFLDHAAALADRPTGAQLSLPSRDIERARVARAHGAAPTSTLAVATLPARGVGRAATAEPAAATAVRDAREADADDLARLWIEQTRYENRMGSLRCTPAIEEAIRDRVPEVLTGPDTVLVGVRADAVVSAVVAESPADSAWALTRLIPQPASYLAMASTSEAARGAGVATAVVGELHRRHAAAGLAASVLHYGIYNPLSVPFWSQRGYRPLVTSFGRTVG